MAISIMTYARFALYRRIICSSVYSDSDSTAQSVLVKSRRKHLTKVTRSGKITSTGEEARRTAHASGDRALL